MIADSETNPAAETCARNFGATGASTRKLLPEHLAWPAAVRGRACRTDRWKRKCIQHNWSPNQCSGPARTPPYCEPKNGNDAPHLQCKRGFAHRTVAGVLTAHRGRRDTFTPTAADGAGVPARHPAGAARAAPGRRLPGRPGLPIAPGRNLPGLLQPLMTALPRPV